MKCVITGVNVKVFARAIHSLAKLGEELYVEPNAKGVCFRTVNSTRSAFATFLFSASFFSSFDGNPSQQSVASAAGEGSSSPKHRLGSDDDQDTIKCKVAMKAFLSAFKSLYSVEKTVERCRITLDGGAAKLQLQLWCRHSVVRTYNLAFIECETLKAVFDEASCIHKVTSQSRLLSDAFANFQAGQDEVSFSVTPSAIIVRNYVDDEPDLSRVIRTELHIQDMEFDEYQIASDCEVVFCLKELRALLGFSEPVHLPVTALFSQPGSPIIFTVENQPLYECKFVLATLISTPGDTQTTAAGGSRATNPVAEGTSAVGSRGNKRSKLRDDQHHTITHHSDDAPAIVRGNDSSGVDVLRGEALGVEGGGKVGGSGGEEVVSVSNRCIETSSSSLDASYVSSRQINGKVLNRLSHMPVPPRNNIEQRSLNNQSRVPDPTLGNITFPSMQRLESNTSKSCNNEVILIDDDEVELDEPCLNNKNDVHDANTNYHDRNELEGTPSPPAKRKRAHFLFRRCFNATYDPMSMPGCDIVLAKNSDSEED